jgi:predicted enzyme related to lactoylglutathione lyase
MAGEVVNVEIPSDDTARAREFWGGLFGWRWQQVEGPFEYHTTRFSEQTGGAITNMEPGKRAMRVYFAVDDIQAGASRVKELGGHWDNPAPVPGMGWFATCRDPEGTDFGLWQNDSSAS